MKSRSNFMLARICQVAMLSNREIDDAVWQYRTLLRMNRTLFTPRRPPCQLCGKPMCGRLGKRYHTRDESPGCRREYDRMRVARARARRR